jgi:hypothetical protein
MKPFKVLFLFALVLAFVSTQTYAQRNITVINPGFEKPDSGKIEGFDGKTTHVGTGYKVISIPGWNVDSPDSSAFDSGVEPATNMSGKYRAYLMGYDPGIYQVLTRRVESDDQLQLTVDAVNNWQATKMVMELFYMNGDSATAPRVVMVEDTMTLTSAVAPYSISINASADLAAIGHHIGIYLKNSSPDSASWLNLDNVRLMNVDSTIIELPNYSFELPDSGKINGWDNDGTNTDPSKGQHGINVPGWTDDSLGTFDSGIEKGGYVTDGAYDAYMGGTPDPPIFDVASYVIRPGDVFKLRVDAANGWNAPTFHLEIGYYDTTYHTGDSANISFAAAFTLYTDNSMIFYADSVPKSIGHNVAVLLENEYSGGWIDFDNVRLNRIKTRWTTIAEARKQINNPLIPDHSVTKDTLIISGVVTSPNLQVSSTAYFIQDATAGVEVFATGLGKTTFVVGDSVLVIGQVAQYHGLTEFTPLVLDSAHFTLLKHKAVLPKAKLLTLSQYVKNAENYEGLLIQIDTLYKASGTWPAAASSASIYVTDRSKADTAQIYVNASTDIGGSTEPAYPVNAVFIGGQYSSGTTVNGGYELLPRDTSDFVHITVTKVANAYTGIPTSFVLENNYPNPFNPSTTILYGIAAQSHVTVKVYSVLGQEIATIVNGVQSPSYYSVVWNGTNSKGTMASSGVYFYRITAAPVDGKTQSFTQVKKMLLMK